jgi:hypothetical protein
MSWFKDDWYGVVGLYWAPSVLGKLAHPS